MPFDRTEEVIDQLLHIARTAVGQFPLGLRPDSLIRIQFRRIGGKVFDGGRRR